MKEVKAAPAAQGSPAQVPARPTPEQVKMAILATDLHIAGLKGQIAEYKLQVAMLSERCASLTDECWKRDVQLAQLRGETHDDDAT